MLANFYGSRERERLAEVAGGWLGRVANTKICRGCIRVGWGSFHGYGDGLRGRESRRKNEKMAARPLAHFLWRAHFPPQPPQLGLEEWERRWGWDMKRPPTSSTHFERSFTSHRTRTRLLINIVRYLRCFNHSDSSSGWLSSVYAINITPLSGP